ncbi:6-phosphogluconolactonase [Alkalilacustris brevis]|uniref:6-phosphogluconolactonase n=1 Tax=Alkalilacustris brevis TaxID=2026338 RepID=UPI000E0CC7E9|nr:6-phosphogluconolactonase [Alkalilacustris brevis]
MTFQEYPDREMMFLSLADRLAGELSDFLRRQDRVTFAVPGGTTPGPVFDVLSGIELDWERVTVVLTDERWVPADAPRSNTRLVHKRLLQGNAAQAQLVPMIADDPTPQSALPGLTEGLTPYLPLTVLLAGMGGDLHTASLFAGSAELAEALASDAPPLVATRPAGSEEWRVTLSAPVLRKAMTTHVVITGPEKRAALERAADMTVEEAPIRLLLDQATVHWAE